MKIVFDFDEPAALHFMGCVDVLTFFLSQQISKEKQEILRKISSGISNNQDICLDINSESFPNRAEFAAVFAKLIALFVRDQGKDVDFQPIMSIGTPDQNKE